MAIDLDEGRFDAQAGSARNWPSQCDSEPPPLSWAVVRSRDHRPASRWASWTATAIRARAGGSVASRGAGRRPRSHLSAQRDVADVQRTRRELIVSSHATTRPGVSGSDHDLHARLLVVDVVFQSADRMLMTSPRRAPVSM